MKQINGDFRFTWFEILDSYSVTNGLECWHELVLIDIIGKIYETLLVWGFLVIYRANMF